MSLFSGLYSSFHAFEKLADFNIWRPTPANPADLPLLRGPAQTEQKCRRHAVESSGRIAPDQALRLWFKPLMKRHIPEKLAAASRALPNRKLSFTLSRHSNPRLNKTIRSHYTECELPCSGRAIRADGGFDEARASQGVVYWPIS
jgi:hypothetical protein